MEKNDEYKDIPLTIAFIGTLLVNVPQLYKTWKTKEVESFSVYTILLRIFIHFAWITYGFMEADVLIVVMSVEVLLSEALLLLFKWMYSSRQKQATVVELGNVQMGKTQGLISERTTGDNIRVLVASV